MLKPKHRQLYDLLSEELLAGKWPAGNKLPTLRELASRYGVSINVASQAVELLKGEGVVTVKVGDGIYSTTSGRSNIFEFKHSGERLFGRYAGAKLIRVLVEDSADWQLEFWNGFFGRVSHENPDIEFQINFHTAAAPGEPFDLLLGSADFLAERGMTADCALETSCAELFHAGLYDGLLLTPEQCRMGSVSCRFPFGYVDNELVSPRETPEPFPGETVLEYVERLAAESSPLRYGIKSGLGFLADCGIFFTDMRRGAFAMPDKRLLMETAHRMKKLFTRGDLVWAHGTFHDYREVCSPNSGAGEAVMAEVAFNSPKPKVSNVFRRMLPYGRIFSPVALMAAVSSRTLFPEEIFRVLAALLERRTQEAAQNARIFHSIRPEVATPEYRRALTHDLPEVLFTHVNVRIGEALRKFVSWELFYYLSGRRGEEFAELLERKILWFLADRP